MSAAQVIPCTRLEVFRQSLSSVKSDSDACIVACVTNFMTDSPESSEASSSVSQRVDGILKDFFEAISEACLASPARQFLICPPMYRHCPLWFRDGMGEVLHCFSSFYAKYAVARPQLSAMPGFPKPSFESDGVHLTPYSGLEYVLHLFDRSETILSNLSLTSEAREPIVSESARLLTDQVIALHLS